jgi:hypothetical protein
VQLALPALLADRHPTFNVDQVRPYHDGVAAFPGRPPPHVRPPPVFKGSSAREHKWEVEELKRHKRGRGPGGQYLVKWAGYPVEESTWEPAARLVEDGLQDLIDAFWKRS